MSTYDKASLVLIPSGTKEGVCFSQKPTNGDGDFTFSRSTAATRVNSDGLIEKETQNLLLQSNTFDNAVWNNQLGGSVTGGQTGYDGTNDAWLLNKSATSYRYIRQFSLSASGVYNYSIYAKANTLDQITIFNDTGGTNPYAKFSLVDGSVVASSGLIESSATDVGSGWWRLSATFNDTITTARIYIDFAETTAGSIYIQDAQLEEGLVARDYIETTTTAVYGGITDNVPRLDYTDSSCPALLLEPQRTNSLAHSEYIAAGVTWSTSGGMLTESNSVASPENLVNATKMTRPNGTGAAWLTNFLGGVVGQNQVLSVYAKAGTATIFNITYYDATAGDLFFNYDLSSGSVSAPTGSAYYVDSSIEDVGNGWYRCVAIVETANSGQYQIAIGNNRYGAANEYLYVYGTQWESNASYPTSYIPTYGTSVTRNADAASKTGVSDLIGQTEGTLFLDFEFINPNKVVVLFTIHDNANNKRLEFWANNNVLNGFIGGSVNIAIGNTTITNGRHKAAIAYDESGDQAFYVDGVQIGTSSTAYTIASLTSIRFDHYSASGTYKTKEGVKQSLLFKTRLTNEELATLTTL